MMLPEDWAYECWGLIAFSTHTSARVRDWRQFPEAAAQQTQLLRSAVAPLLHHKQWFFRRMGLKHHVPQPHMAPGYITVCAKLDPQRGNPEPDLRELRSKLRRKRRNVPVIRCWDGCYGDEQDYGPPVVQGALHHCCCDMTEAFMSGGDPYEGAVRWVKQGGAQERGVTHWLSWIIGEQEALVEKELQRRLAVWHVP